MERDERSPTQHQVVQLQKFSPLPFPSPLSLTLTHSLSLSVSLSLNLSLFLLLLLLLLFTLNPYDRWADFQLEFSSVQSANLVPSQLGFGHRLSTDYADLRPLEVRGAHRHYFQRSLSWWGRLATRMGQDLFGFYTKMFL